MSTNKSKICLAKLSFLKELLNNVISDANNSNEGHYMLECVNNEYVIVLWPQQKGQFYHENF